MSPLTLYTTICAFASSLLLYCCTRPRSRLPLPPGPRKLPLVGNLFDIPAAFQWETYMEWSKTYRTKGLHSNGLNTDSDICHLDVAGTSMLIISSAEVANDLLEKRSALYSDRARVPMMTELMGWDFLIGWRSHRWLFHHEFHFTAARAFQPCERAAINELLRRLLSSPDNCMDHLRHMAGEIIIDPYVSLAESAIHQLSIAAVPGKYLMDSIPILKYVPDWFPVTGFKQQAKICRDLAQTMVENPFAESAGNSTPCFTAYGLRTLDEYEASDAKKDYPAGADTTVSALGTFILGMVANPEAQKAAQREIDEVVGNGWLPDFDDEPALPYVAAIVKEALRWRNVTPIASAIPHFLPIKDEYCGYCLPANSIVIPNMWAITHDKVTYPDPYAFAPDRFLLNGKLNPAIRSLEAAFGFGRRVCPGRHMATSSVWITVASILATFNITKAIGAEGKEIELSYEYVPGMVCVPAPFKCSIKPRSQRAVQLVQATLMDQSF
ncbi:cytochrome P450 [Mycena crocata]|nr:cytochrome P450 [Mycena crocata]